MKNKEFAQVLEQRLLEYGVNIIKLSSSLPQTIEGNFVRKQNIVSGTSVGANYQEVNRSKSIPDFRNKAQICAGEANETLFWLRIIDYLKWSDDNVVKNLLSETNEILANFTSIINKLK
ncbi:MAG: four helix bundle protein [Bacteroidales bacterium]|nr:four helix bundle protein [Bacteroidales bacterium]